MHSLVQSVPVTEDTPADMLAGSMDLAVELPSGAVVRSSVQRATPMLDLLVQLCTAHRLAPGSHRLQPQGERGPLPFKPSTPIGLLDALSVRILPKNSNNNNNNNNINNSNQPFQHTFRLQVHLPRNQLLVARVSPQMSLSAVLQLACQEKSLDMSKYELRHPGNVEERLRGDLRLCDYGGLTEVVVVARGEAGAEQLAVLREQERRRRRRAARGGYGADHGGRLGKQSSSTEVSGGSGSGGSLTSSGGSTGARSSSPEAVPPPSAAPRPPARKRRPAPPPPAGLQTPAVTHSRTSSDSSGYHEASVLSDSPDGNNNNNNHNINSAALGQLAAPVPGNSSTLPRRSKLPPATDVRPQPLSRSLSNINNAPQGSLASAGRAPPRKKRPAPPPPPPPTSRPPSYVADIPEPARIRHDRVGGPASRPVSQEVPRTVTVTSDPTPPQPQTKAQPVVREDSLVSNASSTSSNEAASAVRPARSKDKARTQQQQQRQPPQGQVSSAGDRQPDVVAAVVPPGTDASADQTVDEGIGGEDAAEEVERAFAAALEGQQDYRITQSVEDRQEQVSPPAEWTSPDRLQLYDIPAPPSAFRDDALEPPPGVRENCSRLNPIYDGGGSVDTEIIRPTVPEESSTPEVPTEIPASAEPDPDELPATLVSAIPRAVLSAKELVAGERLTARQVDVAVSKVESEDNSVQPEVSQDDVELPNDHHHQHHYHHHLHHEHHHHHGSAHHHEHHHVEMPSYLTDTIDVLEGFEDLSAPTSASVTGVIEHQEAAPVTIQGTIESEQPLVQDPVVNETSTKEKSSHVDSRRSSAVSDSHTVAQELVSTLGEHVQTASEQPESKMSTEEPSQVEAPEWTKVSVTALGQNIGADLELGTSTASRDNSTSELAVVTSVPAARTETVTAEHGVGDESEVRMSVVTAPTGDSGRSDGAAEMREGVTPTPSTTAASVPVTETSAPAEVTTTSMPPPPPPEEVRRRRTEAPRVNFTITTYRRSREIDADAIFAEAEAAAAQTATPSSRWSTLDRRSTQWRRSVHSDDATQTASAATKPGSVAPVLRRSSSSVYAALQSLVAREEARQKAESTSVPAASTADDTELQSPQVLRSILPQLKQSTVEAPQKTGVLSPEPLPQSPVSRSQSPPRPQSPVSKSRSPPRPQSPVSRSQSPPRPQSPVSRPRSPVMRSVYRPPAVSLAPWGERAGGPVAIKADGDYRIGFGARRAVWNEARQQKCRSLDLTDSPQVVTNGEGVAVQETASSTQPVVRAVHLKPTATRSSSTRPVVRSVWLKPTADLSTSVSTPAVGRPVLSTQKVESAASTGDVASRMDNTTVGATASRVRVGMPLPVVKGFRELPSGGSGGHHEQLMAAIRDYGGRMKTSGEQS